MQNIVLMREKFDYKRNMPQDAPKKTEQILINVDPETFAIIEEIREKEDRQRGYVARELMLRGLALYSRDGRLRDEVKADPFPNVGRSTKQDVQRMIDSDQIVEIEKRIKSRKRKTA